MARVVLQPKFIEKLSDAISGADFFSEIKPEITVNLIENLANLTTMSGCSGQNLPVHITSNNLFLVIFGQVKNINRTGGNNPLVVLFRGLVKR